MPVYKTIVFNTFTRVLIWHITESYEELLSSVVLKEKTKLRLQLMKSEQHRRAFLSVRMLLKEIGYLDLDLDYDESGKPYLNDEHYISISHSYHFSAIIISNQKVGVDIEKQREKIIRLRSKFLSPNEIILSSCSEENELIKKLTVKWCAKEAIFKIKNQKRISFKDHIQVSSFEMVDQKTTALLTINDSLESFLIYFEELEGYILAFALQLN